MPGTFVSNHDYQRLLARSEQEQPVWLEIDRAQFDRHYNRRPFMIRHRLHESPLFTLPALLALARRMPRSLVHHRFGEIPQNANFDTSLSRFKDGLSLEDAIDHLAERRAYIGIYNPEADPEYLPLIEALVAEVARHTADCDPDITWYSTYVFISAQQSVTPYHMDREMNFLLQVQGHKIVQLWDQDDTEIMSEAQKDYLLASVAADARPRWKPEFEAKAMRYDLHAGDGVHHPFIAPHLVRTGNGVSVSLALTWRSRRSDTWTDAHRLNQRMRRLGLTPAAVGEQPARDEAKAALVRALRRTRALLRPTLVGAGR